MSPFITVPIILVASLFGGAVIGAQWLRKDNDASKRPFKQSTAIALVTICSVIFAVVVVLAVLNMGGRA